MNIDLKSFGHAAIAHGFHIYLPIESKNYVLASRLVCAECHQPWYMNFTECFICGAMNPFLYRCSNCRSFNSITNASGRCNSCSRQGTLHLECPSPECLSNTEESIHEAINGIGGVFNKNSGFRISLQRCLNCGSQFHTYIIRKIYVFTLPSMKADKATLSIDDPDILSDNSLVIFRVPKAEKILYSVLTLDEYLKAENDFKLEQVYDNIGEVFSRIFS